MSKKWYNLFVSVDQPDGSETPEATTDDVVSAGGPGSPAAQPSRQPSSMPGPRTPAQTVADIAASIQTSTKLSAAGTAVSFDEIYNLADIQTPAHGYTIAKVASMLDSEHLRGLPPNVKKASVLTALEAAGVKIEEVVQDAIKRDRALDAYERAQQKSLETLEASKTKQNQDLQAELDKMAADYQARMRANSDEVAHEKERFFGWRLKKQQEEQKIADAVGYFLTENPITTSTSPAPQAQPADSKKSPS